MPGPLQISELRRHRLALGLTQAQLAAAIGTSQNQVSRWECGHVRPCRIAVRAIERLTPAARPVSPPD